MGPPDPAHRDPGALARAIRRHVETAGPIGFDEYVAHALYTPELGFYMRGAGAGRRRDFLTSPEVGPLFGAVLARAIDSWWDDAGRPERIVVIEAGAGPGTLARTVLAAGPRCLPSLDLVLVEPGTIQWRTHPDAVRSLPDLPAPGAIDAGAVVVLANELLDNLPFGMVERTPAGWSEVRVGPGDGDGVDLGEALAPLDATRAAWCDARAPHAAPGSRFPVQSHAAAWLGDALSLAATAPYGRVVAIDYASTSDEMSSRPGAGWLRTYAAHGRAGSPLLEPGSCDITAEVAVDQLSLVRPPSSDRSQADFLRAHGLDELVEEGRVRWEAGGLDGGLDALAGRSRVTEADALTDPGGLGAFRVLEWAVTEGEAI